MSLVRLNEALPAGSAPQVCSSWFFASIRCPRKLCEPIAPAGNLEGSGHPFPAKPVNWLVTFPQIGRMNAIYTFETLFAGTVSVVQHRVSLYPSVASAIGFVAADGVAILGDILMVWIFNDLHRSG